MTKTQTPAIPYRLRENLVHELEAMASSMYQKTMLKASEEDFIAAFIRPAHLEKIREVQELVGNIDRRNAVETTIMGEDGTKFTLHVMFHTTCPVLVPQYAQFGMHDEAPDEVRRRIQSWADERIRFGYAVGLVKESIHHLGEQCKTIEAVKFLIPCLPTLLAKIDGDEDGRHTQRANRIANSNAVPPLPPLPREVKDRLREASALVSSFALTEDAPSVSIKRGEVAMAITRSNRVGFF